MIRFKALVVPLLFFILFVASHAYADEASDKLAQARQEYLAGEKAFNAGDFDLAIFHWERALEFKPDSTYTRKMLGMAREKLAAQKPEPEPVDQSKPVIDPGPINVEIIGKPAPKTTRAPKVVKSTIRPRVKPKIQAKPEYVISECKLTQYDYGFSRLDTGNPNYWQQRERLFDSMGASLVASAATSPRSILPPKPRLIVVGQIKNTSSKTFRAATIYLNFFDGTYTFHGSGSDRIKDLLPGESAKFVVDAPSWTVHYQVNRVDIE